MILTVLERLMAQASLAQEGDILFLRLRNQMIDKLGLSEEEITEYGAEVIDGQMRWKLDVPQEKDIDLSSAEVGALRDSLMRLNRQSKLTPNHVSLYDKIVR